jgi:DNA-binding Lrp family transcriptional regulator
MGLKEVELKLVSELMQNCRRSDRELAEVLGVAQPTISRIRKKLENEGYVREYAMIPDFAKLGYEIMALTFVSTNPKLSSQETSEVRKIASELITRSTDAAVFQIIMVERGMGMGYSGVFVTFHKSYSSYQEGLRLIRAAATMMLKDRKVQALDRMDSFLVNLKDEIRYRPLSFSALAKHLIFTAEPAKKKRV